MNSLHYFRTASLLLLSITLFIGCSKDQNQDTNEDETGSFSIYATDAPSDDAKIEGVFVTVTDIRVDNENYKLDNAITVELSALVEGKTAELFDNEIKAGTYSKVDLVLSYSEDASGNQPGCYVLTEDGKKHDLATKTEATGLLTISNQTFTVDKNTSAKLIVDFDLRKAIQREEAPTLDDQYSFRLDMENAVRASWNDDHHVIEGKMNDNIGYADDLVVAYVYTKGEFDIQSESDPANGSTFDNAVGSATVKSDGSFSLHFLPKGDYEIVFINHTAQENGHYTPVSILNTSMLISLDLFNLSLTSNTNITIDIYGEILL